MALNLGDILVRLGLDTGQFSREMRSAQRQLQGAAGGFRQAGQAATMAFTAPLVAAGAVALKFAADFDSAMTQSMAIMTEFGSRSQLTAEGQEALRGEMEATARTIAKDLNLAAADAAKSYFFLASAGMDAQQSIAALPQVAAFAKAGMFDFATATDLATDAQSALGLKSQDVAENLAGLTRVTDVLVRANQLANASVEQFSLSLTTKAGAALKVANKDIEEGVAVLAAFADQGVKAQDAGTALNIVLRDLSTKAIKNKDAFKAAGVAVFDAEDNYRNMADIIGDLEGALGGMSDAQKKATLLQLGFADKSVIYLQTLLGTSEAIREYEEELRSAGGAAKEVAEAQLKAFNEQMGLLQKRVIDAAISVGSKLMPIILDFVDAMEPVIVLLEDAAEWFANWPKPLQMAVVAVAGLVAAIGPLLMAIGFIGQGVASLIAVWPALTAAFGFVTATAIPAIVAAFQTMAVYITGTVVPAIVSLATTLSSMLLPALAAVVTAIAAYKLTEWAMEWSGLRDYVDAAYKSVLDFVGVYNQEIPVSAQQTDILAKASMLAGEEITNWGEAMAIVNDDLMKARERMERYTGKLMKNKSAAEALTFATNSNVDALSTFADAMGISRKQLDHVAKRLGMTTKELFDSAKASEMVATELKKMATEAEAAEKRLRDMVKTVGEAEKEANDLARAVELEGGAMALTREETLRLAAMIEVWRKENIDVAKSLEEVEKRAKALTAVQDALNQEMEITSVRGGEMVFTLDEMAEQHQRNLEKLKEQNAYLETYADELDTAGDSVEKFGETWETSLQDAAAIMRIFEGTVAESIGRIIGAMAAARDAGGQMLAGIQQGGITGYAGAAAGAIQGAGAFMTATEGGGLGGALGGAATGAAMGSVAGPWGTAIGAGVGALIGYFRDGASAEIAAFIGGAVSEELQESIEATAESLDVSKSTAALLHLGEAFAEAGGVGQFGMERAQLALGNLIDFTVRGEVPMAQGLAEIGQAFAIMAEGAVEAGGVATKELFQVIKETEKLGQEIPAVAAFISEQVTQAVGGITGMVGEQIGDGAFGGIQVTSQADAQAQATIFSTTFFAAIEELGLRAAVESLGPAFDVLKEKIAGFGAVDMGGMERFFEIAKDPQFGPLLDGIQGLSDTLAGAANAGFLTTDMFNAIQHQGLSAFEQLTAAGLSEQEALIQMAPLLQNMIDASNQYGMALDPATAALIDQAEAAGVAFSADPMYVMADAMMLVATLLGATEEQLASIGETAGGAAGSMADMAATGQGAAEEIAAAGEGAAERIEGSYAEMTQGVEGEFYRMEDISLGAAKEIASTGEMSARDVEESYSKMVMGVGGDFETMERLAQEEMELIASIAGDTAGSLLRIGEAASDSAEGFDDMATAAQGAARAIENIPNPPGGGGATPMQHGGLVTKPTLALLGEEGPELVIPASDLGRVTARDDAGIGGLAEGRQPLTINFDFSGAIIGDSYRLSQQIGEAVGLAIENNEGEAGTRTKNFLDTRA